MQDEYFLRFLDEYIGKTDRLLDLLGRNPVKYSNKIYDTMLIRQTAEVIKLHYIQHMKVNSPETTFSRPDERFLGSTVDKF